MAKLSRPHRGAAFACALALLALGCASAPPPTRVRFAEIGHGALAKYTGAGPLIVEFQAGDRMQIDFSFKGEDFELVRSGPPFELVAKRHCFVRFDHKGIRVSLDGQNFDQKPSQPGSFRVGLGAKKGEAPKLDVAIVAPKR